MRVAIVGPGAIGSVFAYQLARAGHAVTVIARGNRLAWLEEERAIVLGNGERAPVDVAAQLDASIAWDLVLVTVLAPQVSPLLSALRASPARRVMFMFNTFESIEPLRAAIGPERFAFGFPAGVFALLANGRVNPQIRSGTVTSDPAWARAFTEAGVPTAVETDMQSWLRTHAAMVVPLMAIGTTVFSRRAGISWKEAGKYVAASKAGVRIVEAVGNELRPPSIKRMLGLPSLLLRLLLWTSSRSKILRDLGALGVSEPRMLIDMMTAAAPTLAEPLRVIRP